MLRRSLESILEVISDSCDDNGEVVSSTNDNIKTDSRGFKDQGGGLVKVDILYL